MNIQTEHLENHTARLVVEIEPERWEKAKKQAARKLSKRYRIDGFRKGKAPYHVVQRFIGEAPIVENAMEELGNQVYKDALDQSDIKPYTSGALEDFQIDPPTYIFSIPLQPEIELSDYRSIRLDYEAPEVTDEQVDNAMRQIQQREALVEESTNPIQVGDRVTLDIHSEFADGEERAEETLSDDSESDDDTVSVEDDTDSDEDDTASQDTYTPMKGDQFVHHHDYVVNIDTDNEPILPGFAKMLVGANVEEDVEFDLTVAEDDEDNADIAGRNIHFSISVNKVENVTLPELNDELAARLTEAEDEPLTLLQLRMRTRENLQTQSNEQAEENYANQILDLIIEDATVSFPQAMVSDQVHEILHDLDNSLRQQGMDLETYQKVTGTTHEDLHVQYEPQAENTLRRSLALGEIMLREDIKVTEDDTTNEIEKTLEQFGEQGEMFRQFFDTPEQRSNIANSLLYRFTLARLAKIGRGELLDEVIESAEDDQQLDEVEDDTDLSVTDSPADDSTEQIPESADMTAEADSSDNQDEQNEQAGN